MPRIYLISRRDDSIALSDYLAELLRARYGAANVVRATLARDAAEYAVAVERDLRACNVVIVVMGPRWLSGADDAGQPWLSRPDDPARIALATALRLGLLVAPVLSEGARMPTAAELPPDLRALPAIQAFPVRAGQPFSADMAHLYQQINTKLAWRPASVPVAALAILSALLFVASKLTTQAVDTPTAEAFNSLL